MKKIFITTAVAVAVLVAVLLYFSHRSYNVILITIDTQRPDYLSCYNPNAAPTPNIDRIASKGVLFRNAFTLIPITMPAHTSMLTSHSPHQLGVFNNGDRFQRNVPMLTDLLEPKGYTTGAFISLGVLNPSFGLAQGFDKYDANFDNTNGRVYRWASEINEAVLPWIRSQRKKKFFAWIHYSDPHEPYVTFDAPPDTEAIVNGKRTAEFCMAKKERNEVSFTAAPGETRVVLKALQPTTGPKGNARRFLDRRIIVTDQELSLKFGPEWSPVKLKTGAEVEYFQDQATLIVTNPGRQARPVKLKLYGGVWEDRVSEIRKNYAAEVQYVDRFIGQLWQKLDQWKLLNKTIVIITADHGEGLKTHGILGHVDKLWNETTAVPFIVYYPNLGSQGKKLTTLVNHLDIMPTVLDLLHIRNKRPMEGQSLKGLISRSPIDRMLAKKPQRSWTFAFTFRPEANHNSYAVTNGEIKVIHTPTKRGRPWEAYDLVRDPIEKKNLARIDPTRFESLRTMRGLLEAYRKEAEAAHSRRENPDLTDEEQEALRTLGYVANGKD